MRNAGVHNIGIVSGAYSPCIGILVYSYECWELLVSIHCHAHSKMSINTSKAVMVGRYLSSRLVSAGRGGLLGEAHVL